MIDSPSAPRNAARSDDSDTESSIDWYVKQWLTLCQMLDVSDPKAAFSRIKALKEKEGESHTERAASSNAQEKLNEAGLSSVDDALARIRELEEKCDRLETESDAAPDASDESDALSPVSDVLGIRSRLAAQMTRSLADETETLLQEQVSEQGSEPSLSSSPDDILSTMRGLRDWAVALRNASPTTQDEGESGDLENGDEARDLEQSIRRLAKTIPAVDLPEDDDASLRSVIDYLADQLAALSSISTSPDEDGLSSPPPAEAESRSPSPPSWADAPTASSGDGSSGASASTPQRLDSNLPHQEPSPQDPESGVVGNVEEVPDAPEPTSDGSPAPPLPPSTLDRLDNMTEESLNALSAGLLRLADDGTITYANDAARQLPGLDDDASLQGELLYQRVPSTSNTLFLNRFREGVKTERMDVCFPYTFVTPSAAPAAFIVHLYRAGPEGGNWLILDPA